MKRRFELIDLIVAVGVFATLIGAAVLFMASTGTLSAAMPETTPVSVSGDIAMQFIQPVLGQTLVEDYVLKRTAPREIFAAAAALNRAAMDIRMLETLGSVSLDRFVGDATKARTDHEARVQFMLGKHIVNFTSRGIGSRVLSVNDLSGDYNRRMIEVARATSQRADEDFRSNWQTNLGRAIVTASAWHADLLGRSQQEFGNAVVRVARIQDGYAQAATSLQRQLASVMMVDMNAELQADRFSSLAVVEPSIRRAESIAAYTEPRAWPEIPTSIFVTGAAALIGVFSVGLLILRSRPEVEVKYQVRYIPKHAI